MFTVLLVNVHAEGFVDELKRSFETLSPKGNFYGVVLVHDSEGKDVLVLKGKVREGKSEFRYDAAVNQFLIASLTKEFTAAALLHALWETHGDLADVARLQAVKDDLKKPITSYLNDKPHAYGDRLPIWAKKITLEQLLSNTSGLDEFFFRPEYRDHPQDFTTIAPALEVFFKAIKEPKFTPGSEFLYSNTNFILATAILENLTDTPYGAYLDQNFFTPLEMYDTFVMTDGMLNDIRKKHTHLLQSYTLAVGQVVPYKSALNMGVAQGAGGVVSTADDFKRWQVGLHVTKKVLNEDLYQLMIANHVTNGRPYGYGVQLDSSKAYGTLIGHEGTFEGFRTIAYYMPDQKMGVILFSNLDSDSQEPVGSEWMMKTLFNALQFGGK